MIDVIYCNDNDAKSQVDIWIHYINLIFKP